MDAAYDAAYYEDLAGRLCGLVIRLSDRLPADQVQWLHHVTEVGEYGLALDDMVGMLAHSKIAITDQERGDILALAGRMKVEGDAVRGALESCPQGRHGRARPGALVIRRSGHGGAPAHSAGR
jgi:hypothetical protein